MKVRQEKLLCVLQKTTVKMVLHLKMKRSTEKDVTLAICHPPTSIKHGEILQGLCRLEGQLLS